MFLQQEKYESDRRQRSNEKGFTLIEVLTVAGMIAILATMAVVSMRGGRRVAFETKAIAAMKNVAENEFIYYHRYRQYGTWGQMVVEGDLIDPGYAMSDNLSDPSDTPIANMYAISITIPFNRQCFTAWAVPREVSVWHLRTYAVSCDGGIWNSKDHMSFFSTLVFVP